MEENNEGVAVLFVVIVFIAIFTLFCSISIIGAGQVGIISTFGKVSEETLSPGFHILNPIAYVSKIDVRIQKQEADSGAASKDLQTVSAKVALNYHVNPSKARALYIEVKKEYNDRLIQPALQEAVKSATALFTAEELITKRPEVSTAIKTKLSERLESRGIVIDEFSIVNFDFSASFNQAIEAKVTAEQNALASKNKLEQVKYEAEQKVAEAKGKAEAMSIESKSLAENPQVLELRALEKWDGVLPQYMGGNSVPFVNITK